MGELRTPEKCAMPACDALDYVAHYIYLKERGKRHDAGIRWWCLHDDLKAHYRAEAEKVVGRWRGMEQLLWSRYRD